ITDNGREFTSQKFKEFCTEKRMEHRIVSVESHRSNGRVERLIGTIREGMMKESELSLKEKIKKIMNSYNRTYHSGIGCTPEEAWDNESGDMVLKNDQYSTYAKQFKMGHREKFEIGDKVRVAQNQNMI